VVTRQLRAGADDGGLAAPPDLHGVIGNEAVSADDEIEGALALADAALTDDQDAESENVHQHAMDHLANGQAVVEDGGDLRDRERRRHLRPEQRHVIPLGREQQLGRRRPPAGDQHARDVVAEHRRQRVEAPVGVEALEVSDFALAEHQDPRRPQVFVEAGQREAGLLDVRTADAALEAAAAAE
jgi:hypothetical protein